MGPTSETVQTEAAKKPPERKPTPGWVTSAWGNCRGCRDDFYNGRDNCTGHHWCFMLKKGFGRRKSKPPCFH